MQLLSIPPRFIPLFPFLNYKRFGRDKVSELLIISLDIAENSFYTSSHDGKLNLNTLIKSGGGNRPHDARQPASDQLEKVLNPTDPKRSGR
jgi:hypothetical protein